MQNVVNRSMPSVQPGGATSRRCLLAVAIALLSLLAVTACGANTRSGHSEATVNILNPVTVDELLASIANAGLSVTNPRDVTSRDCPEIGCATKVETDTVSIMKFPTPGSAELYAGTIQNRFQIADVVMSFSPSVPAGQRPAYNEAVKRAIE